MGPVITDTTKLVVDDQHPIINMNEPLIPHDDPFFTDPGNQRRLLEKLNDAPCPLNAITHMIRGRLPE